MSLIEMEGVAKSWGGTTALQALDLRIEPGSFCVLLGPSGCGKSTTLRIIAGLESATSGRVRIDGQDVTQLPPARRGIAMVFQNYALYPHMTNYENMAYGLKLAKVPEAEIKQRVDKAAKILELSHLLDRKPRQLSGGQRQRVAMGRAIVRQPQVFLFDEPLSNLDAKLRGQTRLEIQKLHAELGITSLFVTHDQIEAMTLGDKVAVMKDGIIQQFGTPKQIYNDPANLFVASFIGSPPMNFIPLRLQRKDGRLLALLDSGQARCELPLGMQDAGLEDREVILGIRPEQIALAATEANGLPTLRAEVQVVEPTGPDTLVFVTLNGTKVCCRLAPDQAPEAGETLTLQFDPARVLLFDAQSGERLGAAGAPVSEPRSGNVAQFKGR